MATLTNYCLNPRATSAAGGFHVLGGGTGTYLTGQTGWADETTTCYSIGNAYYIEYYKTINLDGAMPATVDCTMEVYSTVACSATLFTEWYAVGGGLVSASDQTRTVSLNAGHTVLTFTLAVPATGVDLRLYIDPTGTSGGTFQVSNLCFGSATFFDGSTADTASYDYAWTGTAGSSRSTRTDIVATQTTVTPGTVISNPGGWTAVGAADIAAAMGDASDSTYAESPAATAAYATVAASVALAAGAVSVGVRAKRKDATAVSIQAVVRDSTGAVVSTGPTWALTDAWTDYVWAFSGAENTAFSTRTGLRWEIHTV